MILIKIGDLPLLKKNKHEDENMSKRTVASVKDRNTDRRTNYGPTEGMREEVVFNALALHLVINVSRIVRPYIKLILFGWSHRRSARTNSGWTK